MPMRITSRGCLEKEMETVILSIVYLLVYHWSHVHCVCVLYAVSQHLASECCPRSLWWALIRNNHFSGGAFFEKS